MRDHDRDHDREPGPVDEDGGDHRPISRPRRCRRPPARFPPACAAAAGCGRETRAVGAGACSPDATAGVAPAGGAPGFTFAPGRTRCKPSTITVSPAVRPAGHDRGSWARTGRAGCAAASPRSARRPHRRSCPAGPTAPRCAGWPAPCDQLDPLDGDGDELAIGQVAVAHVARLGARPDRVGNMRPQRQRVGVGRHARIDVIRAGRYGRRSCRPAAST